MGLSMCPGTGSGLCSRRHTCWCLARRDPAGVSMSRLAPGIWRAIGLALVAGAAWWMNVPDDTARAEELAGRGKFAEGTERATRAIQRAPLAWRPYFTRAGALAR